MCVCEIFRSFFACSSLSTISVFGWTRCEIWPWHTPHPHLVHGTNSHEHSAHRDNRVVDLTSWLGKLSPVKLGASKHIKSNLMWIYVLTSWLDKLSLSDLKRGQRRGWQLNLTDATLSSWLGKFHLCPKHKCRTLDIYQKKEIQKKEINTSPRLVIWICVLHYCGNPSKL